MQSFILENNKNKILSKRNFILLTLLFSCTFLGFSQTTGGGVLAPLVSFLNQLYLALVVVFGAGAVIVIATGIFSHMSDPNWVQLIIKIIGSVLVVVFIIKAPELVTMVGGSTMEPEVIKTLYF